MFTNKASESVYICVPLVGKMYTTMTLPFSFYASVTRLYFSMTVTLQCHMP